MTRQTAVCARCGDAPHPDVLLGLHANYKRLTYAGYPVPAAIRQGEATYQHVRHHQRHGVLPGEPTAESPDALVGGEWVRRGLIQVWQEAS